MSTLCAEFYRPLVERLGRKGICTVGKGGWRGRYRSFQSGLDGVVYGTRVEDGMAHLFLCVGWRGLNKERFNELQQHQKEIGSKIGKTVYWMKEGEYSWEGFCHILLKNKGSFSLTAPEKELEDMREWVADNLLSLRRALQPLLDQIRQKEDALPDKGD